MPARHNRQVPRCGTYPVARYVVMRRVRVCDLG